MAGFVLPALAAGGKLLGFGSLAAGTVLGANEVSKLPGKWKEEAYAAGPDYKGNFSAGFGKDLFINEAKGDKGYEDFMDGYEKYVLRDSDLLKLGKSLGVDIQFDPGKTKEEIEILNSPAIEKAKRLRNAKLDKEVDNIINPNKGQMTPLQIREQNRADLQLTMLANQNAQTRADSLTQRADALALERERMEREDHRYNQELMRFNENRRMESISGLAGGLAALAAAFAM
jgi:hypothetical protein